METSIRKKVSLVLRIFDDYTLRSIEKDIFIYLNNYKFTPIKKSEGEFIFINLQETSYEIHISSELYYDEIIQGDFINLDKLNPVVKVRLRPKSIYEVKEDGILAEFKVWDKARLPVVAADIKAIIYSKDYYVGQVNSDTEAHVDEIYIEEFHGNFTFGDSVYIDANENSEFLTILNKLGDKVYKLKQPMLYQHLYGEKLRKAFITKTDNEGKGLVYFRNILRNQNQIKLIINFKDTLKEVIFEADKDKTIYLGEFFL